MRKGRQRAGGSGGPARAGRKFGGKNSERATLPNRGPFGRLQPKFARERASGGRRRFFVHLPPCDGVVLVVPSSGCLPAAADR